MKKFFRIERKIFSVECIKEWIMIEERGRGFVTKVYLLVDSALWVMEKLKGPKAISLKKGPLRSKAF